MRRRSGMRFEGKEALTDPTKLAGREFVISPEKPEHVKQRIWARRQMEEDGDGKGKGGAGGAGGSGKGNKGNKGGKAKGKTGKKGKGGKGAKGRKGPK